MKVLLLTHRLPYAPNRGDRIRSYHLLHTIAAHAEVHLVSLVHDAEEEAHVADLQSTAASVTTARVSRLWTLPRALATLPTSTPLTHALLDAPDLDAAVKRVVSRVSPQVTLAYCSGMARLALAPPLADRPLVLDMVDVDSEKWATLAADAGPAKRWIYRREARTLRRFEAMATARASATLVVNEKEASILRRIAPGARVLSIPNGVDVTLFRPRGEPANRPHVVFCGVMSYAPNEAGAIWLAERVWPLVKAEQPEARLSLVGAHPTARVQRLTQNPSVEVTGTVDDVRPWLWSAAVGAAPVHAARGVQNKVLEAVAAGLPSVVTPAVFEGLPPEVHCACSVGADASAFAAAILRLLRLPPHERRRIAGAADLAPLEWQSRLSSVPDLLTEAWEGRRASSSTTSLARALS